MYDLSFAGTPPAGVSKAVHPLQAAKVLADSVIPNEYGIDPEGKLKIGSKICTVLLGKILSDLQNMREESLVTAVIPPGAAFRFALLPSLVLSKCAQNFRKIFSRGQTLSTDLCGNTIRSEQDLKAQMLRLKNAPGRDFGPLMYVLRSTYSLSSTPFSKFFDPCWDMEALDSRAGASPLRRTQRTLL